MTSRLAANADSVVVRVPVANILPATADRLLATLSRIAIRLALTEVTAATVPTFLTELSAGPGAPKRAADFLKKAELIKLQQAQEHLTRGEAANALPLIDSVRADATASVEGRFAAELMFYVAQMTSLHQTAPNSQRAQLALESNANLRQLARKGYPHLKMYALIRNTALEVGILVDQGWGLMMNRRIQPNVGDPLWAHALDFQIAANLMSTARKYRQLIRLTDLAIRSPYAWAVPNAIVEVPRVLARFANRLDADDRAEAALSYRQAGLNWCRLVLALATKTNDVTAIGMAVSTAAVLSTDGFPEPAEWANEEAKHIRDPATRSRVESLLREIAERRAAASMPSAGNDRSEVTRQIYVAMAESLGVDLTDGNDSIARVINIGLEDLDPTRALTTCEHLFMRLGPQGLPAQWLGLPTAASKTLYCTLHRFGVGSFRLDDAIAGMKREHCDSCSDRRPRGDDWKFSAEWQAQEDAKHGSTFRDPFSMGAADDGNEGSA